MEESDARPRVSHDHASPTCSGAVGPGRIARSREDFNILRAVDTPISSGGIPHSQITLCPGSGNRSSENGAAAGDGRCARLPVHLGPHSSFRGQVDYSLPPGTVPLGTSTIGDDGYDAGAKGTTPVRDGGSRRQGQEGQPQAPGPRKRQRGSKEGSWGSKGEANPWRDNKEDPPPKK